ncbi:MAG TPA: peptidoglycan DD-metalloendopeptidase family protein [Holophagaceae bacterium]|nr:peptidoglycan DD-metalloendopeptidase family protein [Holophagaceae bacterium]
MKRFFLSCFALGLTAQQGGVPQDPAELKRRLAEVQGRLAQVEQQVGALKKRRRGILVDIQSISLRRDQARAQVEGARLRRDQAQTEVHQITAAQGRIQSEMLKLREDLRRQVRWMQAMGPFGAFGFYSGFQDVQAFVDRGRLLAWQRLQERKRLDRITLLQGDLATKERDLKAVLVRLAQEEQQAAALGASLRLTEEDLQKYLDGLSRDEDAQRQVQAELAEEALQLERMLAKLLGVPRSEAFEPATKFAELRGELPGPVEGSLAEGFGEHLHPRYKTKRIQSGLLIEAAVGARVSAVADGRVIFAEPYQSYGPMVILDHGGGWFTLYQHLQGIIVSKGQVLRQGDPVGTVGETVDGPRLGFEVRMQAKPEDPNKWLKRKYR